MIEPVQFLVYGMVFFVAMLYSSVGHGGASGYLAILALFGYSKELAVPSALILNVLVASSAFIAFQRKGYFNWRLTWPFIASSVPFAFLGGHIQVSSSVYSLLLACALCLAAWRLWFSTGLNPDNARSRPTFFVGLALLVGMAVGFVSGIIGIGGGIFLSPLLLLSRWANAKETAATSSIFIVLNSLAALKGHLPSLSNIGPDPLVLLVVAAFCGGLIGSKVGAGFLSHRALCRVLSLVLFLASVKLLHSVLI